MAVTVSPAWIMGLAAVGLCAGAPAEPQTPAEKCVFEGTATDSATGMGLGKVSIHLVPMDGAVGYAGASRADGSFRFEGMAAGEYHVLADRTGYSSPWVLADAAGRTISDIRLTSGQTLAGSHLWMTPDGEISGKVTGPDSEPIPDARITLIQQQWRHGMRIYQAVDSGETDDWGVYRSTGLPAGRYFLYASAPAQGPLALSILDAPGQPERRLAGRYHPNATALDGATAIDVAPGQKVAGIDFQLALAQVYHVSGQVAADSGGVRLKRRLGDQTLDWEAYGTAVLKDGSFDLTGVPRGDYYLYAEETAGRDRLTGAGLAISVEEKDSTGVTAPPVRQFTIHGQVRLEGAAEGPVPVEIFFEGSQADEFTSYQRRVEPDADGNFEMPGLTPDRYAIRVAIKASAREAGYYLKAVMVGGVPAPHGEIDLAADETVDLVLSDAAGTMEGFSRPPRRMRRRNPCPSRRPT